MKMFGLFAKNDVLFRSPKSYLVIIINFFLKLQDSLYRSRSILQRLFGFSIAWSTKIFMVKASRYLCLSRFEFRRSLLYSKLQSLLGQQKFAKLNVGTAGLVTLGIDPTPEDRYFIRILVVAWSTKAFTTGWNATIVRTSPLVEKILPIYLHRGLRPTMQSIVTKSKPIEKYSIDMSRWALSICR